MKNKVLLFVALSLFSIKVFSDSNEDLFEACKQGNLEKVKKALSKGADVNAVDAEGHTPIGHSFFWPEIVGHLLDNGADASISVVMLNSCTFYCEETFKVLMAKGVDPQKSIKVGGGKVTVFNKLLDDEKAKGEGADKEKIKYYEKMIKSAGKNIPTTFTVYPFFAAIGSANKVIIDELVKNKVNFKFVGEDGLSSIGKFVQSVRTADVYMSYIASTATALESRGYKVPDWFRNIDQSKYYTPAEVLNILSEQGADLNQKVKTAHGEKSPLLAAIGYKGNSGSDPNAIIALIKKGANANEEDDKWGAVINLAIRKGNLSIVKALVESGANVNIESKEYDDKAGQYSKGFTPLTIAAMVDKLDIVKYLLDSGAKPAEGVHGFSGNIKTGCATDVKNKTAIFFAIENGNFEMVKTLVESTTFNWGEKKYETKQLTLSNTHNTTKVTSCFNDGSYTPSQYAKEVGAKNILEYLKSKNL